MTNFHFLSKIEQAAAYLRNELAAGRWVGVIPGRLELASELGMNARTAEEALRQLEREGLLEGQGAGKRRKILLNQLTPSTLKIRTLHFDKMDQGLSYDIEVLHRLREKGYSAAFANHSLHDLGMDVKRVAAYVKAEKADVWMVCAGSRDILEWFAQQPTPAFAQFGRHQGLPLAGIRVNKIPAMKLAVRRLHELGHRRMVLMVRNESVKPRPGLFEQAFLDELHELGIATGDYHLPDWGSNEAGFHRCLDALFQHTRPTALLLSEVPLFVAAQHYLARRGIVVPRDISLLCHDPDNAFSWCNPPVSHINWNTRPIVNRMVQWVDNIARGKKDLRQNLVEAKFVEGGTIGPVTSDK
jgi:DNA-binding LacI/PurR family transcriptional regulator/DNA-binding transcriptional regulator YhcF (GntR family)